MSDNSLKPVGRFKRYAAKALGIDLSLTSSEGWAFSKINSAGQLVNESTVLSLSAAWACTKLISESIGTLPLHIYERGKDSEGRRIATDHDLYRIMHNSPNKYSTASTYWEASTAGQLLRGNSYSRIYRMGKRIVALEYLPIIKEVKDSNGIIVGIEYKNEAGKLEQIPLKDVFHVPAFSLDGKKGVSAIQAGAAVFGSALASNNAANNTFQNGLSPTVSFSIDRVLNPNQREQFRESLQAIAGAINAGKSPLLEGGMKAEPLGIPPKDAQLLESRAFSVEEVCRWFGVDPSMVGSGGKDSNWGTGLEQKMIGYLTFTLTPILTRIEQRINKVLLSPEDQVKYYAEFTIEGLLRGDTKTRAEFYKIMVNNGLLTRDEVRVLENRSAKGGNADKLTVHGANITLDNLDQNIVENSNSSDLDLDDV